MRDGKLLLIAVLLVVIGILGLLLVSGRSIRTDGSAGPMMGGRYRGAPGLPGPMGPMMGRGGSQAPSTFRSNGERIYYTATSDRGDRITFSGGPPWLYMHGGSCVDCHGPGGKGGEIVPMTDVRAADIRYSTLTSKTAMAMEHPPYTDALIKRAITKGLDPAGKPLNDVMPRWHMSNADLNDLIAYLKTLPRSTR